MPVWSAAVTEGDVDVAIGTLSLSTGAGPGQRWAMVAGALALAGFGARRQFARLGVSAWLGARLALRRPIARLAHLRHR